MTKHFQEKEPRERPELSGLEIMPDGTLAVKSRGSVGHGSVFTRIGENLNENCPEYILGQMALEAGYGPFEEVEYELRVKPKPLK